MGRSSSSRPGRWRRGRPGSAGMHRHMPYSRHSLYRTFAPRISLTTHATGVLLPSPGTVRQGGGAQQGRKGNQDREAEWSGWESVRMGGSDNKGDGLASQLRRNRVPGQPLLNRHEVGGVSRSPEGLFAQQEREPTRARPAVWGKGTHGGRSGHRVEEQGIWASRTRKHNKAGYGRPVDRGAWTATTVKRPRQQPAQPQYANYWVPLTRKRHTMPQHSPGTPTTGLRERGNDTSRSTGRSGRQNAATKRNMRREERVTVQGPVKKQQPDGMSHRGAARRRPVPSHRVPPGARRFPPVVVGLGAFCGRRPSR